MAGLLCILERVLGGIFLHGSGRCFGVFVVLGDCMHGLKTASVLVIDLEVVLLPCSTEQREL